MKTGWGDGLLGRSSYCISLRTHVPVLASWIMPGRAVHDCNPNIRKQRHADSGNLLARQPQLNNELPFQWETVSQGNTVESGRIKHPKFLWPPYTPAQAHAPIYSQVCISHKEIQMYTYVYHTQHIHAINENRDEKLFSEYLSFACERKKIGPINYLVTSIMLVFLYRQVIGDLEGTDWIHHYTIISLMSGIK